MSTEPIADQCLPADESIFDVAHAAVKAQVSIFAHWTDKDLYRAIDLPENGEPGEAQEREIAEYVAELQRRKAQREAEAQREADLRAKYQI